jgi:uncharacterized protein with beta-barrel porin domain
MLNEALLITSASLASATARLGLFYRRRICGELAAATPTAAATTSAAAATTTVAATATAALAATPTAALAAATTTAAAATAAAPTTRLRGRRSRSVQAVRGTAKRVRIGQPIGVDRGKNPDGNQGNQKCVLGNILTGLLMP